MKAGRNEPCPCGSGKKYKRCCGQELAPSRATLNSNEIDTLVALLNQGRSSEAEHMARALLNIHPNAGMLWKIMSVALATQGKEALPAIRRTAELMPNDAEVHGNLAAALGNRGQWVEAVAAYRRALEINPHLLEAQNNLGNALVELGRHEDAVGCFRAALRLKADDAEVHSNLGNALRHLGSLNEAIASSRRAIELKPTLSAAHNNLGVALAALGQFEEAVASYRRALTLDANPVEALNNLGNALRDLGELRQAVTCFARAIELEPRDAASHCNLGNVLLDIGRLDEAAASYTRALALKPDEGTVHLTLSMVLRRQGRAADAEASCRAALAIQPQSAEALSFLGELYADRGQFSQAQESFQQAIAINPNVPNAWSGVASHRKMTSEDTAWLQGTKRLVANRLPLRHEIGLRYALGKYFDDIEQYEQAFGNYRQANELAKRYGANFDRAKLARRVDDIISQFDSQRMHRHQAGASASERPVFIVGMPRSGTSLTEQILASHPAVLGAGELTFWDTAFAAYQSAGLSGHGDGNLLSGIAGDYLDRLAALSSEALRVVDKMPANFMNLGLIRAAFPRARIIHMRRHPIDTCLSIYFQYFSNTHPYANDLDDLAHYYGEYVRITNHWRTSLPEAALLEIPYEALVEDQESWSRRMVEFIGLPWDPKCLDFHQTNRVVITTSKWQVRQKIHASSAGRFRNYEKFIGPLQHLAAP
jgi:tetratricopeptide (TPR) repeat protein